jgi:hypothetical protein
MAELRRKQTRDEHRTKFKMKRCFEIIVLLLLGGGLPDVVFADELKVDLSRFTGRADTAAPHFTEWQFNPASPSRTFGNVTVAFSKIGSAPGSIDSNWYKFGIDYGALLACDAVFINGGDAGGQIQMTVSGLAPGQHTIATYHNSLQSPTRPISAFDIYVNGSLTVSNVQPTIQATNDYDIASAYFPVTASAGQNLVLTFIPRTNAAVLITNIYINGFEIDSSNPATKAIKPIPANDDEHINADNGSCMLNWTSPTSAVSHDIYFSVNDTNIASANRSSPYFQGNQSSNGFLATNLNSFGTYYWRVDELDAAMNVTHGEIWRFRARHLAFPGAEGYGRFARGGRSGRVIEVTNLQDYDSTKSETVIPGSYRAAIEAIGPRTIVFRISGFIALKRPCTVNAANGYVTIAGQTAPGDGICIGNYRAGMGSTRDVIMRFIRNRVGDFCKDSMDGIGMSGCDHSIIDHCSISWSIDEGTSSRSGKNISFQRNIICEALNNSYHYLDSNRTQTERHSFAGSISGGIGSYHHNLLAHNTGRNWSLAGGLKQSAVQYDGYLDIRNNVIYNWKDRTTDGGAKQVNFVANYYRPGPVTTLFKLMRPDGGATSAGDRQQYFVTNNVMEGQNFDANNWSGIQVQNATEADVRVNTPFFPDYVTTQTAREAYKSVLCDSGANQPRLDFIDARAISNTFYKNFTFSGSKDHLSGIIDSQDDVGGYPTNSYATYDVPIDSDHDGMPDWWELLRALNPFSDTDDFSDSNSDPDGDGYTNLEDYLNWLASPHGMCVRNSFAEFNLKTYAAGLTNPVLIVSSVTNGMAILLGDNRTARFTPTADFTGTAGFRFTLSDGVTTFTNGISVMVTRPIPRVIDVSRPAIGMVSFSGTAMAGANCVLQMATNFPAMSWENILTNNATDGTFHFVEAAGQPQRFYRVLNAP